MTREQAIKKFEQMSLTDCIKLWNEKACDHYCRFVAIHKMSEEEWWNALSKHIGAWDLIHVVIGSGEDFNDSDEYFFFDEGNWQMRSFSTKQEMIEVIGEDFFLGELVEQKMVVNEHGRLWEVLDGTLLKDTWLVGDFDGIGTMYMNNVEGYIILWERSGRVLKSDI